MLERLSRYGVGILRRVFLFVARNVVGTITHVTTRDSMVALTFDDGPDVDYTPRLLGILERYRTRATFFMTGEAAQRHPELVKRVAQAGHAIGNHSWDHPSFPYISARERRAQIRACAKAIAPYGERLFRPPYGHQNIASRIDALLLGYQVVMFDGWANDWRGGDADTIVRELEERIHPGNVIVLHDRLSDVLEESYFSREPMLEAVEMLLNRVGERFRFVTIPELLRHGRAHKVLWYKEGDPEFLNKLRRADGHGRKYVQNGRSNWLLSLLHIFFRQN
jgi:peptidoglycan/xylan/chitin deacetylase (PgdA/CDA1 family)